MWLRQKIRELVDAKDAYVQGSDGVLMPSTRWAREYAAILGFLSSKFDAGGRIAISLEHGYRYLLCELACMELGLPFVPMSPGWPAARVDQVREASSFAFCIDPTNIERICGGPAAVRVVDRPLDPEAPLYVAFTSGTTGAPKGVVIRRKSYENVLRWMDDCFKDVRSDQRILMNADFTFDLSLFEAALFLLKRGSLFFSGFRGDFFKLADEIGRFRITTLASVPNCLGLLFSDEIFGRADLSSLQHLFVGGARFSHALWRDLFTKLGGSVTVFNLYGSTETTLCSHFKKLSGVEGEDSREGNISIGSPLPGVLCELTTEELWVGGAQVMAGYAGDADRTAEVLVKRGDETYYRTGDIAFRDQKGEYHITGRTDDTLKRRGYRVNLLDIDAYIQNLPGVQDAVTVAIPSAQHEHLLVSYVIARKPMREDELREKMSHVLVGYQVPDCIEFVESFPLKESGKVCRKTLIARYREKVGGAC